MTNAGALWRVVQGTDAEPIVERGAERLSSRSPDLRPEPGSDQARLEALVRAVWLVLAADELLTDEEIDLLVGLVAEITRKPVPPEQLEPLFERFALDFADEGAGGAARSIARALGEPALGKVAFQLAAATVCRGGRATADEETMLEALADALGLSADEAATLLDEAARKLADS